MQLFTGARGGDIEEAAGLVQFAFVTQAIDPLFGFATSVPFCWKGAMRNSVTDSEGSESAETKSGGRPRSSQESMPGVRRPGEA